MNDTDKIAALESELAALRAKTKCARQHCRQPRGSEAEPLCAGHARQRDYNAEVQREATLRRETSLRRRCKFQGDTEEWRAHLASGCAPCNEPEARAKLTAALGI
jgi:hypothetical protein